MEEITFKQDIIDKEILRAKLLGSLLSFTKTMFKCLTSRDFIVSQPLDRESHQITICKLLTKIQNLEILRSTINVQPGSGKSTLLSMFTAWSLAKYPDSNFLYITRSHELATSHTHFIKRIMELPIYKYLFDVEIMQDSRAKDSFKTLQGGGVKGFGSGGAITGQDAGLPFLNRFSGAIIIDDIHKPDEVHSDNLRNKVINNYFETIKTRCRGINVPIINISQRLHEDDFTGFILSGKDTDVWHTTILKSLDENNNALYPEVIGTKELLLLKEKSPYVFASQYQQDPIDSNNSIFKKEWFVLLEKEPEFICTFILCDTAETDKSYNDPTVFSFFGVYFIEEFGVKTNKIGVHVINCVEIRVEPKDLIPNFIEFYQQCLNHKTLPHFLGIEKKSTGVTLISNLSEVRTLVIKEIERNRSSGSKTTRFLKSQYYVASKLISLTKNEPYSYLVINHMCKITANNSHKHDDICDTVSDAIDIVLVNQNFYKQYVKEDNNILKSFNSSMNNKLKLGKKRNERII